MGANAGGAVLDRIVYRWQERDLLGMRGLGPLATSLTADRLPVWAAELDRHVGMDVDVETGPYTSVCWARTSVGPALIHREFALRGSDNRPGNIAHAVLDPDRVLGPHVVLALGVFDWAADGLALDDLAPGTVLPGVRADRLVALAHERASVLRAAARDHGAVLARVAETLLARPRVAISLLRGDTGPDPVPLLWGVFDLVSHLVRGSWSFSTYETDDDASRPRFVVVPRWPAADSPSRIRVRPGGGAGDGLFGEAARRLVTFYTTHPWDETRNLLRALRSAAELDPEPKAYAILDALAGGRHRAAAPGPVSLRKNGHGGESRAYSGQPTSVAALPGWVAPARAAGPEPTPGGPGPGHVPNPGPAPAGDSGGYAVAARFGGPPDPGVAGPTGRPVERPVGPPVEGRFAGWAGHAAGGAAPGGRAENGETDAVTGDSAAHRDTPGGERARPDEEPAPGIPAPPVRIRRPEARPPVAPPFVERPSGPAPRQPDTRYLPVALPVPERPDRQGTPDAGGPPAKPVGGPGAAHSVAANASGGAGHGQGRGAAPGDGGRGHAGQGVGPAPGDGPRQGDHGNRPRRRSPASGASALAAAAAALDRPTGPGGPDEPGGGSRRGAPDWSSGTAPGPRAAPGRSGERAELPPAPPVVAQPGAPERISRDWDRAGWAEDGVAEPALHALVEASRRLADGVARGDREFLALMGQVDLVAVAVGLERADEALLPALVERLDALVAPPGGTGPASHAARHAAPARLPSAREQAALEHVLAGLDGPMRALDRCGMPRDRIASVVGRFAAYVLDGCQTDGIAEQMAVVVRNLDTVSGTYRPYQQELIRAAVAHGLGPRFFEEIGRLWAASRSLHPDPADPLEG